MTQKTIKIITAISIFGLCFITHFLYDWFPNALFAIFLPVNESIWEHMKMIFTTTLLGGIIEYFLLRKNHFSTKSLFLESWVAGILCIIIYLVIYLPIYYTKGSTMFLTIFLLLISIVLSQWLVFLLRKKLSLPRGNQVGIILIIITFIIMGILTYHPPHTNLFFDPLEEKYGIHSYNI